MARIKLFVFFLGYSLTWRILEALHKDWNTDRIRRETDKYFYHKGR